MFPPRSRRSGDPCIAHRRSTLRHSDCATRPPIRTWAPGARSRSRRRPHAGHGSSASRVISIAPSPKRIWICCTSMACGPTPRWRAGAGPMPPPDPTSSRRTGCLTPGRCGGAGGRRYAPGCSSNSPTCVVPLVCTRDASLEAEALRALKLRSPMCVIPNPVEPTPERTLMPTASPVPRPHGRKGSALPWARPRQWPLMHPFARLAVGTCAVGKTGI